MLENFLDSLLIFLALLVSAKRKDPSDVWWNIFYSVLQKLPKSILVWTVWDPPLQDK